ncbi:hypothetical protein G7054_g13055 [Neopestalotiopsis clavispora]|nr:hypothetical protein G7054_g13055 [Neopestalotiopsis clavispora]
MASLAVSQPVWPHYSVEQEHFEVLKMRSLMPLNPSAVYDLSICGGIAGSETKCRGAPAATTGHSGSARFSLEPVNDGAAVNISKDRWEQCVRAARSVCPTGSMSGTCRGGATSGDLKFTLEHS